MGLGALAAHQAVAQEPSGQSQQPQVTVTGYAARHFRSEHADARDLGQQGRPAIDGADHAGRGAESVAGVRQQLVEPTSGRRPVAAGGSNLNLRGLDAPRTLMLLDGRRLGPSNNSGTVDVGVIPERSFRTSRRSRAARPPRTAPTPWRAS